MFLCYKPSKKYHVDLFHPSFKGSHPHLYSLQRFSMENQPPFFWESGDGLLPFAQATGFSARAAGGWHSYPLHRGVFAIYQGWTGKKLRELMENGWEFPWFFENDGIDVDRENQQFWRNVVFPTRNSSMLVGEDVDIHGLVPFFWVKWGGLLPNVFYLMVFDHS